jgi:stage II sporulation protein D
VTRIIPAILIVLAASSCAAPTTVRRSGGDAGIEPLVRVLLAEGRENAVVTAAEGATISAGGVTLLDSGGACTVSFTAGASDVTVSLEPSGRVAAAEGPVTVTSKGKAALVFDSVSYAGSLSALAGGDGTISIVNTLPLERYLEGVLPHEMGNPGADGFDALKAQAVAARTYAIERIELHADDPFDLHAGVRDQVYQGLKGGTKTASSAVAETRGLVLRSGGGLVKAYYSACCGGHTSDIRLVWPERESADYLFGTRDNDGQNPGSFCAEHRYFRWRYSFSGKELGDMLRETLPRALGADPAEIGEVIDVTVESDTPSGRAGTVLVRTTKKEFRVSGDKIRWVLMADPKKNRILPSIMIKLEKIMEGGRIAFLSIVGGGNGHGVGMCQGGAIAMSKKGYTYRMILQHYYGGSEIAREYP